MSLKYKLGDVVVLGENVDTSRGFTPGVKVRIGGLCDAGTYIDHYTVYTIDSKCSRWWVYDDEINHKATEELQKSNESPYIAGKEQAVSDDNAKEVRTPVLEENATQKALQSAVEVESNHSCDTFASVYSSVSVFRKDRVKEGDSIFYSEGTTKITIDEDGGEFLVFQQDYSGEIQEIRLDFGAVGVVFSAANELIVQYKEKTNE